MHKQIRTGTISERRIFKAHRTRSITTQFPGQHIMFSRTTARALSHQSRLFSSSASRATKVAVLGAGGGIGQPLSLLLKSDPLVSSLSLYDIRGAPGVAADVSHVDTASEVRCSVSKSSQLNGLIEFYGVR